MIKIVLICSMLSLIGVLAGTPRYAPVPGRQPATLWNDLRVKFSPNGANATDGFYRMPLTAIAADAAGYVQPPEERATDVQVLCPANDPALCMLYDRQGNVAGMQIAVLKAGVQDFGYPFENHPMFVSKRRFGHSVYMVTLYFVEQSVLKSGGRRTIYPSTGTGLWLQIGSTRQHMYHIPRIEQDIIRTPYRRQGCVPGMGRHYYYDVNPSISCNEFHPIFALFNDRDMAGFGHSREMIGFGFKTFGKVAPTGTAWFERIPAGAITVSVPDAPQCLVDAAQTFDIISLHVYFVHNPWTIMC